MANVTYTNLFSEARNNIVSLITSNVSDPVTSSSEFRKWIYSRLPDVKDSEFSGYPLIIVHPADVDIAMGGSTLDGKSKNVSWDVEIEIVTSDRGYGGNSGKGLTHMDSISDSLMQVFMDKSNRNTLTGYRMQMTEPTTTNVVTDVIADELIYRRSIMFSFSSRIHISA